MFKILCHCGACSIELFDGEPTLSFFVVVKTVGKPLTGVQKMAVSLQRHLPNLST